MSRSIKITFYRQNNRQSKLNSDGFSYNSIVKEIADNYHKNIDRMNSYPQRSPYASVRVPVKQKLSISQWVNERIFQKIIELFNSIFFNDKVEPKSLPTYTIEDASRGYILQSDARIVKLKSYKDKYKLDLLNDVYDYSKMTHDVIVSNDMKPQLLEQFHTYYTDNFLNLFDKVVDNNKLRISLIEKKKGKIKNDIENLKIEKSKETQKIDKAEDLKISIDKYTEFVSISILKDIEKKVCFGVSKYDEDMKDMLKLTKKITKPIAESRCSPVVVPKNNKYAEYSEYIAERVQNKIKYDEYLAENDGLSERHPKLKKPGWMPGLQCHPSPKTSTWKAICKKCQSPVYYCPVKLLLESSSFSEPPRKRIVYCTCTGETDTGKHTRSYTFPADFIKIDS